MLHRLGLQLWNNLGGCARCIRKSFQIAVFFWATTVVSLAVGEAGPFVAGVGALALGASLLWIANVIAFAARKASRAKIVRNDDQNSLSRRDLGHAFGTAVIAITAASAVPAFAQTDGCNCITCMGPSTCCGENNSMGCSCGYQYNVACYLCC